MCIRDRAQRVVVRLARALHVVAQRRRRKVQPGRKVLDLDLLAVDQIAQTLVKFHMHTPGNVQILHKSIPK